MQARLLEDHLASLGESLRYENSPTSPGTLHYFLPDGRKLAYQEFGKLSGFPLFYFHDSGSSRLECAFFHSSAFAHNYRLIAVDRPGIGDSDYCVMNSPIEFCRDLLQLAESLGLARFGLMSLGSGGIFSLNMAHRYPERISYQLNLAGVPGSVFNEVKEQSYAASCWNELAPPLINFAVRLRHLLMPGTVENGIARLQKYLCSTDRRALRDPAVVSILTRDQEEAMRTGYKGVAQDLAICFRKLDFRLQDVTVPTTIWQGSADRLSQRSDCEYMVSRMPRAKFYRVRNRGHFFFMQSMDTVFGQLENSATQQQALAA